jgi:hypothetical protein
MITILYTLRKKGTEVSQSVRSHFFFFYNSEPSRLRPRDVLGPGSRGNADQQLYNISKCTFELQVEI